MASSEQLDQPPFNWGDTVRIIDPSLPDGIYGQLASVCGFRLIDEDEIRTENGQITKTWLVLVEIANGSSFEIRASNLEVIED